MSSESSGMPQSRSTESSQSGSLTEILEERERLTNEKLRHEIQPTWVQWLRPATIVALIPLFLGVGSWVWTTANGYFDIQRDKLKNERDRFQVERDVAEYELNKSRDTLNADIRSLEVSKAGITKQLLVVSRLLKSVAGTATIVADDKQLIAIHVSEVLDRVNDLKNEAANSTTPELPTDIKTAIDKLAVSSDELRKRVPKLSENQQDLFEIERTLRMAQEALAPVVNDVDPSHANSGS